jgi:hypothetical protein
MDVVSNASERGAGTEKDQGRRVRVDELPIGQAIAQPIREARTNSTAPGSFGEVGVVRI